MTLTHSKPLNVETCIVKWVRVQGEAVSFARHSKQPPNSEASALGKATLARSHLVYLREVAGRISGK